MGAKQYLAIKEALSKGKLQSLQQQYHNAADRRADAEKLGWIALAQSWAKDEKRLREAFLAAGGKE